MGGHLRLTSNKPPNPPVHPEWKRCACSNASFRYSKQVRHTRPAPRWWTPSTTSFDASLAQTARFTPSAPPRQRARRHTPSTPDARTANQRTPAKTTEQRRRRTMAIRFSHEANRCTPPPERRAEILANPASVTIHRPHGHHRLEGDYRNRRHLVTHRFAPLTRSSSTRSIRVPLRPEIFEGIKGYRR